MGAQVRVKDTLQASTATLFDALAWETELAAARCILLDAVIGEMIKAVPESSQAEFLDGMHTVDLLSQQLTGLSAFARRMSGSANPVVSAPVNEALDEITLGSLADRMCAAFGGDEQGIDGRDQAGDLDLF